MRGEERGSEAVTSSRPCAVCRKAPDRNTALGRVGPRTHNKKKGSFVRLGHRPHGSLQASGQARTVAKQAPRGPQKYIKDNRGAGVSGERVRVLSRVVLIRPKKPRRGRGQVRKRHRTAADKRDETHPSLQAPEDPKVGQIGNLVESYGGR